MMKNLVLFTLLAACGGKQQTNGGGAAQGSAGPVGVVKDTRTEIEKRRDAACESLGPRITACAVEDAKQQLAAGKVGKPQLDQDTAPAVQKKNTEKFVAECRGGDFSSRQVRVLEVCQQQERACEPLLACLAHLNEK